MSSLRTLILIAAAIGIISGVVKVISSLAEEPKNCPIQIEASDLLYPVTNKDLKEEIVDYKGYTVSFNSQYHIPNWVSWELTASKLQGHAGRHDKFMKDPKVDGCPTTYDYRGSGYSRGHMVPAADMKWDSLAMVESFYMTNICPQVQSLNSGAWGKLESKCREWAALDSTLIIICGPVLTSEPDEFIGDEGVAVPKSFFKVVLAPKSNPPRGIGFIMPNAKVIGGLQATALSIDSVEALTGHDFFQSLPDSIENIIESKSDFHKWSNRK